jgi:Icc-related predicted phosphoesterase
VKLLVFSDIHSDARALERLMSIEADYYFCAGDLVNFSRGLDAMGEILKKRGDRAYVIPGNHESAQQVSDLCARFGLKDFHGGRIEIGGFHVIGLGYSNPTPFDTPGEYSRGLCSTGLRICVMPEAGQCGNFCSGSSRATFSADIFMRPPARRRNWVRLRR